MATIRFNEKKGYYEVRYDAGFDGNGNRIQKYKGGFKKEKDAKLFAAKLTIDISQGTHIEPNKMFLFEYLNNWLEEKRETISPTSYCGYEVNIRCHINPYIGGIKLSDLRAAHIRGLYSKLQKAREAKVDGKKRSFKPLSGTSIRYVHRVLSKALEDAYREETIPKNPAKLVTPPSRTKFEAGFLTTKQIRELLDKFREDDLFMPVFLSVVLGARRGEVLGLHWTDVDMENKLIHIRHNLIIDDGTPVLRKKTKTDSSNRVIVVTDRLIKTLKDHKLKQKEMKLQHGELYHKSDYVCTWPDGKPFNPSYLSDLFRARLKRFGLPVVRFHDLRHSNAALMIAQNVPLKGASDRLGHSTIQITNDLYGHTERSVQEQIAMKIDQAIWGS
ncbi:site-specific integrase [Desulforamulus aquiferis]|uniref:Site-specific integrase n=1 Tax=Desulforamulus aquiferis TaxID=1397668 RepID=A0AAW7ZHK7_9FIRM|nr:site-specific integrase [Desulforamulus aquiferis]MDO7788816.1 site-specific integrase [Desulforamulus aquiferis]